MFQRTQNFGKNIKTGTAEDDFPTCSETNNEPISVVRSQTGVEEKRRKEREKTQ